MTELIIRKTVKTCTNMAACLYKADGKLLSFHGGKIDPIPPAGSSGYIIEDFFFAIRGSRSSSAPLPQLSVILFSPFFFLFTLSLPDVNLICNDTDKTRKEMICFATAIIVTESPSFGFSNTVNEIIWHFGMADLCHRCMKRFRRDWSSTNQLAQPREERRKTAGSDR